MTLFALSKIQDEEVDNLYSSIKLTNQLFAGVLKVVLNQGDRFF